MLTIRKNLEKAAWLASRFGAKSLFLSAGMPRSGSTLLFNILRLILERRYEKGLASGWIEDVDSLPSGQAYLIKTHHLNRLMVWRARRTFYTYRDIRDVLVSRQRKFDRAPTIEIVRYYISQFQVAREHTDAMYRYEDIMFDLPAVTRELVEKLDVQVEADEIIQALPDPEAVEGRTDRHCTDTLLYKNHATGTERREWIKVLNDGLINQIHDEFEWWFRENSYEI